VSRFESGRVRRFATPIDAEPRLCASVSSMLRAAVKLPVSQPRILRPLRCSSTRWVHDRERSIPPTSRGSGLSRGTHPRLIFYPSSRAGARLPETVPSRSGHECCGTFSVAVARRDPTQLRARSARETCRRLERSMRLSRSLRWAEPPSSHIATAQSPICGRPRQSQSAARASRRRQTAGDTTA